jgi:hypothetical protein
MPFYPEIDRWGAHELYHDKGVMFRVRTGGRVETRKGKFFVAADSKWMRIDLVVQEADKPSTVLHIPISQEIVESISPASKLVQEQFGNQVAFVIPQILPLPGSNDSRQAA